MSVPKNYVHNWKYYGGKWTEKKVRPGLWTFKYSSVKRKKAKSYGEFGKGTTGVWEIKAKQYIKKTGKGMYETTMIGTKKPIKFNVLRKRK